MAGPGQDGVTAIVAAAGASRRMGRDKIFAEIAGRPVLFYSLETLQASSLVGGIIVVASSDNLARCRRLVADSGLDKVKHVCPGGARRQDSVGEGLRLAAGSHWVIIHDGARPFLTRELIENGLKVAIETGAAIAAVPVTDTIKEVSGGAVNRTLDRTGLWRVQTPQVFRYDLITRAYREASGADVTDDSALIEALGCKVKVFLGSYDNIKVTTPEDLELAKIIMGRTRR